VEIDELDAPLDSKSIVFFGMTAWRVLPEPAER
jgi:hypothetical protein